ncbi:polysaccharide lyase [Haloprofundus sp. MHR1]|uniref:polysaccharide lyase n=1 Tax=Haloprofundus sp. MHR1 TaxID=2572921 RepID=UPI0010BE96ED|nr:hypothetical protein [Haloprofundus sp. MHR1]QCJ47413.1 hypothetical protein FCF25_09920 [Haloprofundus sp. MHR1]
MTKNHGYNTPKKGTADWNVPLNENFKKIDKDVEVRDVESKLDTYEPAAGTKFLATDTGNRYIGDGEQWNLAPLPRRGAVGDLTAQNRFRIPAREQDPENAEAGELWLRTDENALKVQMANGVQTLASGESSGDDGRGDTGGTTNADVTIDFADDSYLDKFDARKSEQNSIVNGEKARSDTALQVQLEEGSHYGTDMQYYFSDNGMSEPEELWIRYYLRLDPGFDVTSDGGKLPGPAGTYDSGGWGGKPADGTNGWSARMAFMPADGGAELSYYCYHADMNNWGEWWSWDGTIETGQYYQIDSYVKLNTPGENDGILRGWIDGEQAMEKTDIRFRDTEDLKVESLWFNIYHGGSDTSPSDNSFYFDKLQMSTSGPLD